MSFTPYPIVPINMGLERDKEPFLLEGDAFPELEDCYLYQGKIMRREGNKLLGRLVQQQVAGALGNTGASPFVVNVIALIPVATFGIQPGSITVTIAAPIGPLAYADNGLGVLTAPGPFVGSIDYVTGALSIPHPAGAASAVTATFNYYTGRPVMGLRTRETNNINVENLIAFDTVKANEWNAGAQRFLDISYDTTGAVVNWTSTDTDFFWTCNYYVDNANAKLFWATNNRQNSQAAGINRDGIQIYNGAWAVQTPRLNALAANRYLNGCLILIPYRDRMVALNTLESTAELGVAATRYPNRARWCQNGNPYTNSAALGPAIPGADATSWYDNQVGKGGYIDAPTAEHITSCGFYKDVLIVFFERSTWQLLYTGNEILPFVWQKINTNFGCESTFSVVEFDKGVFAVGDKAIVMSDSVNVERIDSKIPLEVYEFLNANNGLYRVHGIRDYFYEFVYWTFPNNVAEGVFPNRLLSLNYSDGSYSMYNDSYTCFGYYQSSTDLTWAGATFSWADAGIRRWNSATSQSNFPFIVAGNQVGFVTIIDYKSENDETLYITGITQAAQCVVTCPNHNLVVGQYVIFSGVRGMIEINGLVGRIVASANVNTITLDINSVGFTPYTAGGLLAVINNIDILTKKFNPFYFVGRKVRSSVVDFFVEATTAGAFNLDVYVDENDTIPMITRTVPTFKEYGPTTLVSKVWNRIYLDCMGQFLQFRMTLSDAQMRSSSTRNAGIIIHAINVWMMESGGLLSYDI